MGSSGGSRGRGRSLRLGLCSRSRRWGTTCRWRGANSWHRRASNCWFRGRAGWGQSMRIGCYCISSILWSIALHLFLSFSWHGRISLGGGRRRSRSARLCLASGLSRLASALARFLLGSSATCSSPAAPAPVAAAALGGVHDHAVSWRLPCLALPPPKSDSLRSLKPALERSRDLGVPTGIRIVRERFQRGIDARRDRHWHLSWDGRRC